jgi:hypothetical protein
VFEHFKSIMAENSAPLQLHPTYSQNKRYLVGLQVHTLAHPAKISKTKNM